MRIAVDIMGGDKAPEEIIAGSLAAAQQYKEWHLTLVGQSEALPKNLPDNVNTAISTSVMAMDESVENLRSKKDSSIWIATKLVKDNLADAVVSAGSTAAQMATALLLLGRIPGITRPAIATMMPTLAGGKIMLDVGANSECTAEMLLQFAQMGDIYSRLVMKAANPQIALLSNGSEECKGTETVIAAHELIKKSGLNFIGNREGRDITKGNYDVLVCDGFAGNVALKSIEGTSSTIFSLLKEQLQKSAVRKMGAAMIMPGLKEIKAALDYAEYGGAPLLGVGGVSIICHGSSDRIAIKNAIRVAGTCVEGNFIEKIKATIKQSGE